jgi:hypothetical protein
MVSCFLPSSSCFALASLFFGAHLRGCVFARSISVQVEVQLCRVAQGTLMLSKKYSSLPSWTTRHSIVTTRASRVKVVAFLVRLLDFEMLLDVFAVDGHVTPTRGVPSKPTTSPSMEPVWLPHVWG